MTRMGTDRERARKMKVRACPFCGNERLTIEANGIGDYFVICQDPEYPDANGCGARTSDVRCESQEYAIERWNRRAKKRK